MTKRAFDSQAAMKHLGEQLGKLLPGLMLYTRKNSGLEFTISTGERPLRVVLNWLYKKRQPSRAWQEKICVKVNELLAGSNSNLFICPNHQGPKGEYIIDLRINDFDGLLITCENDIEVPFFHSVID